MKNKEEGQLGKEGDLGFCWSSGAMAYFWQSSELTRLHPCSFLILDRNGGVGPEFNPAHSQVSVRAVFLFWNIACPYFPLQFAHWREKHNQRNLLWVEPPPFDNALGFQELITLAGKRGGQTACSLPLFCSPSFHSRRERKQPTSRGKTYGLGEPLYAQRGRGGWGSPGSP